MSHLISLFRPTIARQMRREKRIEEEECGKVKFFMLIYFGTRSSQELYVGQAFPGHRLHDARGDLGTQLSFSPSSGINREEQGCFGGGEVIGCGNIQGTVREGLLLLLL